MGQGQGHDKPQVIDANQVVKQVQDDSKHVEKYVKQAFQQASTNGRLYRDKFNEALSILETLNIRRLRDTPIGDRLFSIMDNTSKGYISEAEYQQGITLLINDKERRIMYTFKAYDKDDDGRVSRKEFYEFIKESWISAFRLLAEVIQRGPNPYHVNYSQVDQWSSIQLPQLQKFVNNLFNKLDPQKTEFIELQAFRQWILSNDGNSVRACFDGQEVDVPLNLFKLIKNQ